ncbi:MAG TPA: response regulator [Polyangiaceae bacterium]|nr:response regulator [Polyangiaceae bacterium]
MSRPHDARKTEAERPVRPDALSVVVVDDDDHYRELAAAPFRKRGDYVRTTSDGLEALAMCLKEPPDVILSDVQMPRLDGWQFLRLIRSRPSLASVPVVFLTALNGDPERLLGYQLGVDAYIPKPYTPEELLVRVHQVLRRSAQAGEPLRLPSTLRGELEHVAVGPLLAFLELEKKSGVLLIIGDGVARLFVHEGRLLRAELEGASTPLSSREVLDASLEWTSGQFDFLPEAVDCEDEFERTSVTALLLEHAQATDERKGRR